jgi:hypothetical protein
MDPQLVMDPRLGMIRGSDKILDSDAILGVQFFFFLFLFFVQTSSCRLRALSPSIGDLLSERFVEEALSGSAHITSIHRLTCQKEDSAEIRTLLIFGKHIIVLQNIAPS